MPSIKRPRVAPTDDWQEIRRLAPWPEQRAYEELRPVVLFGYPPAERAGETGTPERTLYRRAARFAAAGMASLFPPPKVPKHRRLPTKIRQAIIALKAEYPAFRANEIAVICETRFGQRPSPHTVKRILAEESPPVSAARRFPPVHDIADPAEARLAVVRLHSEGWPVKSIAAYLGTARSTIYRTLQRWIAEGVAGLDDQSHARKDGPRKVTLRAIATVQELQENPRLGEFRVAAALRQQGIYLSPRTCGRILAKHRALYGVARPAVVAREPKPLPFHATGPHEYWSVDIRYLDHHLGDFKVYCVSVLDNYSRAILASGLSRTQDLTAYLLVLYMAIHQHGAPDVLVSDSGGVFLARQAQRIYAALSVSKEEIARWQPWQNYIETTFNVQRRMADWDFARAATWADLLAAHDQWVAEYNYQDHWAHRKRDDGKRSPADVLGWVRGKVFDEQALRRVLYATRAGRTLDRSGYVRFRRWRLYAERGLRGEAVAVWLYGERLTLAFSDEPLAQYTVTYQPDKRHLKTVTEERLFETPIARRSRPYGNWATGRG
jgi:putative transposase